MGSFDDLTVPADDGADWGTLTDDTPEARAQRPSVMDVAKQALIGLGPDAAQGFGWLLEKAGLDYGREMRRAGADTERDILESMTPGGRRAATTPMFEGDSLEDLGVTDKWGQSLIMGASRSLPQMAQMVIPGAAIAKGVSVIPGVAGLAKAPGIAGTAARYLPGALGFGAAEGLQAGALNAAQTQGEIEGRDPATLPAHSRRYRELLGEMDPAAAQRTLADEAASQVFRRTAPWTGAVGALTGGGALGGLVRPGRQSVLRAIGEGGVSEAIQEAPQSGGERYIQNLAEREFVDERTDPWKQVVAEALTGGAIGGVTGGAVGGAGRVMRGRTVEGEVTGREISRDLGAAREALGDVAQAQQTERAVDTARRTAESLKAKAAALAIPPAKGAADEVEIQDADADETRAQAHDGENALGDAAERDAAQGDADVAAGGEEAQPGVLAWPAIGDGSRQAPVEVRSAEDVERAAATARTDYTPPQGEANNVRRGHLRWNDLEGTIEVPAGGTRKGTNPKTGETWETKHTAPYGYWKGTEAADGMHVDAIWGPELNKGHPVYVIDEIDEKGDYRQAKTLPGFPSEQAARDAYLGISSKKPEHVGAVTAMPVEQFKGWLKGDTTKPLAYQQPKGNISATEIRSDQEQTGEGVRLLPAADVGQPAVQPSADESGANLQRPAQAGAEAGDQQAAQVGGERGDATQQFPAAGEQATKQETAAGEQRTEAPAAPAVQAPAQGERPQQVEKPKRLLPAARRLARIREHFAPGNIIFSNYWRDHDRVLAFEEKDGQWQVQVEKVRKEGDKWVASDKPRWHATAPDARDRIVEHGDKAETAPKRPLPAERRALAAEEAAKRQAERTVATAKEPWQMTRDEYVASFKGQRVQKTGFQNRLGTLWNAHREAVEGAAQLGKPIPAEVIVDYPDITQRRAEQAAISERLRQQNEREAQFESDSIWQRLMAAKPEDVPAIVDTMPAEDAQKALDRLNAAPGDNVAVRKALESKVTPAEKPEAASEAEAATGNTEEQSAAVRDRDEAILSAPEGTAPARDVTEAKVPTQQEGLFGNAITALRTAADELEKAAKPQAEPKPEGEKPMFSRAPAAPEVERAPISPFYSELTRRVEASGMNVAPAKAWKDYIRGLTSKGVKADEIEWSGINEWLDLRGAKVTKEQVFDYLRQNGVRVKETLLGESDRSAYNAAANEAARLNEEAERLWGEKIDKAIPPIRGVERANLPWWAFEMVERDSTDERRQGAERKARNAGLNDEQISLLKQYGDLREKFTEADARARALKTSGEEAKFKAYTLPGGENYRELLLTLPEPRTQAQYERGDDAVTFRSSHFDQPNILAHVRFDERTDADGKKVLFIEEIQSDFGQKTKRARDDINKAVDEEFELIVKRMEDAGVLTVECD